MIVLAVDPGPRWTALVVRDTRAPETTDDAAPAAEILDRQELDDVTALGAWALKCATVAHNLKIRHAPDVSAVEAAVAPTAYSGGKLKMTNPGPIIETAVIVGAIVARLHAVIIPPDGFGAPVPSRRHLEAMYPPSLIGPRETTGSGKSPRQHLRAAFDLAGAAASPLYLNRPRPL